MKNTCDECGGWLDSDCHTHERERVGTIGRALLGGFAFLVGFAVCSSTEAQAHHWNHRVPVCAEDEVMEGRGDFDHGKWSRYACIHPDTITSETIENDYRNPAVYAYVRGSVCEHPRFWNRQVGISVMPEACD